MDPTGHGATPERKLAAIMLADIAGFSALMERDETATYERVRELRAQLIAPRVAEHGGRIIKTTGDGFLAEFPSATSALQCAIAIQRQNHAQQEALPTDQRIHMRVGINVGDIIIDGDDVAGDGVVIAARLEPLAPQDGICVSATVREHIRQELGVEYQDLGDQRVKNISRPIRAYKIDLAGKAGVVAAPKASFARRPAGRMAMVFVVIAAIAAAAIYATLKWPQSRTAQVDTRMTFAVLPLNSAAGDAAAAQFASTLTDVIVTRQANSPWSRVVSRESVEAAMKSAAAPGAVGRALNVRYILRGNVARNGESFNVQLAALNAETEQVLGTRELAWPVSRPLNVHRQELDDAIGYLAARGYLLERAEALKKRPEELDARELVHVAAATWKNDKDSYDKAMPLLRRALELSPDHALALIVTARVNLCECRNEWSKSPADQERIGGDAVDRYLAKYGDYRPILLQKVGLHEMHDRFEDALVIYERMLEQSPDDPELLNGMAYDMLKLDRSAEGLALRERAMHEDRAADDRSLAAALHFKLGHYREAADYARKAIAEMSREAQAYPFGGGGIHLVRAAAEARAGRAAEAKRALEDFNAAVPKIRTISALRKWQDTRDNLAGYQPYYDALRMAGFPD
jgi:adenylate cyclase